MILLQSASVPIALKTIYPNGSPVGCTACCCRKVCDNSPLIRSRLSPYRLNIEHRTSNVEHRIMKSLRYLYRSPIIICLSCRTRSGIQKRKLLKQLWIPDQVRNDKTAKCDFCPLGHRLRCGNDKGGLKKLLDSSVIFLCFLLFIFKIRCWTFDVRCSSFQRSMFICLSPLLCQESLHFIKVSPQFVDNTLNKFTHRLCWARFSDLTP